MSAFEELGLSSNLCELLEKNEIDLPTAIQQESIPLILGGGDLCACAETGTGKTLSFIIASLQIVNELFHDIGYYESKNEEISENKNENRDSTEKEKEINIDKTELQLVKGNRNSTTLFHNLYECSCNNRYDTQGNNGYDEIMANCEIKKGKYAYEVEVLSKSYINIGFCPTVENTLKYNYSYCSNKTKYNNDRKDPYGDYYGMNDIITCLLDKDNNSIAFKKNGEYLGKAYTIFYKYNDVPFVPYVCGKYFHIRFHFEKLRYNDVNRGFQEIGKHFQRSVNGGVNRQVNSGGELSKENKAQVLINGNKLNKQTPFNKSNKNKLFCIVLVPTKDLAMQTYNNYLTYSECFTDPPINIGAVVGGETNRRRQESAFNIIVCTCFKLLENIKKNMINLSDIKLLILDEADELINSDEESVLQIKNHIMKHSTNVQTLFFSATLQDENVKKCINKITNKPIFVDLKYGKHYIPSHIYVCIYYVNGSSMNISYKNEHKDIYNILKNEAMEKMSFSDFYEYTDKVHLLNCKVEKERKSLYIKINKLQKLIHIINAFNMENGIIFCRTNLDCDNVYNFLNNLGDGKCYKGTVETMKENRYSCVVLKGKMPIHERQNNLNAFKKGEVRFLICTDVASRGIDIKHLRHLIIFTLTDNINTFFHKIGRVGRDGKNSLCIVIAADSGEEEKVWFHTCPSRGMNCLNRNLKEDKGCTTYINESEYIKSINDLLENPMHILHTKYFYAENIVDPLNYLAANPTTNKSRRNKNQVAQTIFSDTLHKSILNDFNANINTIRQMQRVIHYEHFDSLHGVL